jgi:hypothetical protein
VGQIALRLPREGESHAPSRKLLLYLLVIFLTWLGFAAASMSAMALAQYTPAPPNPFASFADVFPGQPRSSLIARRFSCLTVGYDTARAAPDETCVLLPASGLFAQVEVIVSRSLIREITFTLREDTLRVGDLMLFWGEPTVTIYSRSVYLYWRSRGVFAIVVGYSERFSLQLPVRRVSIGDTAALLILQ